MAPRRLLEVSTCSRHRILPELIAVTEEGSPLHTLLTRYQLTEWMATIRLHFPRRSTASLAAAWGLDPKRLRQIRRGVRPNDYEWTRLLEELGGMEAAPVTAYMVARDELAELAPRRSIGRVREALTVETIWVHAGFGSHFPHHLLDL